MKVVWRVLGATEAEAKECEAAGRSVPETGTLMVRLNRADCGCCSSDTMRSEAVLKSERKSTFRNNSFNDPFAF